MNEKAAAARRAYKKEWARKNPDKVREHQERYWTKKAEQNARESAELNETAPAVQLEG